MITYVKINGFKSFHEFEMEFTPLTIVAGTNASGKSNLFDALLLLSKLAETDNLKKAFREQRGEFIEMFTQYGVSKYVSQMSFEVDMLLNRNVKDAWGKEYILEHNRLKYKLHIRRFINKNGMEDLSVAGEGLTQIKVEDDSWLRTMQGKECSNPKVASNGFDYIKTVMEFGMPTVIVPWENGDGVTQRFPLKNASRTVLSSFDTVHFPHVFAVREEMKNWKFLQLNPEDLRQPTKKEEGYNITQSGKNLAGALFRIKQQEPYSLKEITRKLQTFLPNFTSVDVVDDEANRQYVIVLKDKGKKEYSSRVLSEGTLRILALCIMVYDDTHTGLLCFEEPENGVHPSRIYFMANLLKDLSIDFEDQEGDFRQVIVNTHSPLLVDHAVKWTKNRSVSLWLSDMQSRITTIEEVRTDLQVTKIVPVDIGGGYTVANSEKDTKMALTKVKQYLERPEAVQQL